MPICISEDTDSPHEQSVSGLMILEILRLCGKKKITDSLLGTAKFTIVRKVEEVSNLRILSSCKRASE